MVRSRVPRPRRRAITTSSTDESPIHVAGVRDGRPQVRPPAPAHPLQPARRGQPHPELVEQTKKLGMNAVRHHRPRQPVRRDRVLHASARRRGINPIIGYEAYLAPGDRTREEGRKAAATPYYHLTLLAKNTTGFKNLIKLSSIAFLEGFYYNPRIDKELLEAHSEGLICLSGCLAGEFNQFILPRTSSTRPRSSPSGSRKVFGDDFYIEIQNNGLDLQDLCTPGAVDIAKKLGLPLVATGDAHYLLRRRRRRPRRALLHQHRQEARPAQEAVPRRAAAEPVLRPQPGGHVPALPRATRTRSPAARRSPTASTSSSTSRSGTSRSSRRRTGKTPDDVPARAVRTRACASATATNPPKAVREAARARARHHLPDGLRRATS